MTLKRPTLTDLPHHVRENIDQFGAGLRKWRADVKRDPSQLFRSAWLRSACWLAAGVAAYALIRLGVSSFLPPAAEHSDTTPLATIYVACAREECGHVAIAHPPIDFTAWPMVCEKCNQPSAKRAARCSSCRAWHADIDAAPLCRICAGRATRAAASAPAASGPVDPDDREDGW